MAKRVINVGNVANDKKGDSLRAAFTKVNENFTEIYTELGLASDTDLNLGAFEFDGSVMSTTDSTAITIDQATTITSNLTVGGDLLPSSANGGDLGSLEKPWRSLHVSTSTIYFDGVPVAIDEVGNLTVNGVPVNSVGSADWSAITNKPTFSTAASSGSYNDLTDTPLTDRLTNNGSELILTGGANPYVTFPAILGGDQVQIAGSEIASVSSNLALTSRGNLNVISNAEGLRGGSSYWIFNAQGDIELPNKWPIAFTAVFDADHYVGGGTFVGDGTASFNIELQGQGSTFQWQADDPVFETNRGYVGQQEFRYTEADHGITGFNVDILMEMTGSSPYSLNVAFSPPPGVADLAKIRSSEELMIGVGNQGWLFGTDGALTLPGTLKLPNFPGTSIEGDDGLSIISKNGNQLQLGYNRGLVLNPNPDYNANVAILFLDGSGATIEVNTDTTGNVWHFKTDGVLQLPVSGDIIDSNGDSVLGGSGNQLVSTEDSNTFTITNDGDVVFSGELSPGGVNRGLVWDYGARSGIDGVNSMVRQDGNGLTVRAWTENSGMGGSYAAPVNVVTGQDANEKVWTFDGNGNLTLPGDIQNSNDFNISINREDSSTYTWNFGNTGDLTLPAGGDILDSNGNSVLGGLPTITVPEEVGSVYKGLQVSYGMVHSNSSNTELNVNKIVIHKPAQTTTTIHPTSSQDDFEVTGLSTSDVVAMFVFYGDANGPKSLTTLQTFAEAVIDNVILDGGVEGEYQTVDQMKAAFYASGQQLQSAAGGLVANFEFWATDFSISNGYLSSGATTVLEGSGAVFDIADNGDGTYYASGIQNSGTNYLAGHKIKVLGTALGGVTPDNDCIVTVDSVIDGGAIFQWSVAGTAAGSGFNIYGSVTGTNYQVGSGAVVDSLFRAGNTGLLSGVNLSSGGTGYVAGDVLTLPGTAMTSGIRPDNDITITVTGVDGSGTISTWNYGGTLPLSFPVNNINDGGEDQYDTANYINFGSAIEIPYNNGDTVTDSAITGGPGTAYSMVYDNSIFGVLVTGSITSIGTSGNSGADGSSITEAGNIYGPSTAAQTFDNAITHINLVGDPYAGAIVSFTRPDGQDNTIDILIADSGVGALEDIYLEQEQIWIEVRNNDAADIAPATRPWDGMPSYQAYDVLVATFPIDPAPLTGDLVPRANNAKNAYLAWQEALADFGPARGVAIARDSNANGIFNPYRENSWDSDVSPGGTLWNIDGWADLSDVESRTYDNLYAAFGNGGLGNKIVGAECVMYLPDNGKYYAVKFDSWTQGGNGGGFSYTRRELDLTSLTEGIRFADGTRLKSAEGLGRVKLESPGNRRIEEAHGYKQISVTARETTTIVFTASRTETDSQWFWFDSTLTTVDDIINQYTSYGIDNIGDMEFSVDNNTWYTYNGSSTSSGNELAFSVFPTQISYVQGEALYFRYTHGAQPVVWWDKNELPSGGTYFRGAVIDYHAYTGDGTIVGTIHIVDDDGEENVTHTEVASGGSSVEWDDLWFVQNEGTISYRRIDGAGRTLKVQWTAKVFYGSEIYD